MTESMIPFDHDDADAPRVRRSVLLAGVAAAVLLGAGGAVFVGGEAEQPSEQLVPLSAVVRAPQGQVAAAPAPAGTVLKVPAQHTEDIARNPFKAQYVEPPPPPPPTPAAAPAVPAVPGAALGAQPLAVPLPLPLPQPLPLKQPGAGAPAPTAPKPAEPVAAEYPITLASVGKPRGEVRLVTWSIDGKDVETVPGQRFGRFGELVVLAYTTADGGEDVTGVLIQVGDANPVTVSIGETVKVL